MALLSAGLQQSWERNSANWLRFSCLQHCKCCARIADRALSEQSVPQRVSMHPTPPPAMPAELEDGAELPTPPSTQAVAAPAGLRPSVASDAVTALAGTHTAATDTHQQLDSPVQPLLGAPPARPPLPASRPAEAKAKRPATDGAPALLRPTLAVAGTALPFAQQPQQNAASRSAQPAAPSQQEHGDKAGAALPLKDLLPAPQVNAPRPDPRPEPVRRSTLRQSSPQAASTASGAASSPRVRTELGHAHLM